MLIFCALIFAATVVYETEARGCEPYPDNHCVLEGKAIEKCPHQERWTFDSATEACILAHWGDHCDPPVEGYNMFTHERECYLECSGLS